jgi:isopentenyl diphosphate isomerase/L-lactate dehydrogenase-like FMN-dependent dehydrogenase
VLKLPQPFAARQGSRSREAGVRHVLAVPKADLDVALALTGSTALADMDRVALYTPVSAGDT